MQLSDFYYNLPKELIAQYPPERRGTSNLLVLDSKTGKIEHKKYFNLSEYVREGDIVVLNETKVLQCRTFFQTPKGKRVEVLFLEKRAINEWYCMVGRARDVNISDILKCKEIFIKIIQRQGSGFLVSFVKGDSDTLFNKYGHTPLPPYIKREDRKSDRCRYNTVFSSTLGAVAAPTASLNLTEGIMEQIEKKGAKIVKIELKVGWGTFQPIREMDIKEHKIHKEYININRDTAQSINECRGRVWAIGTTVARALESAYSSKERGVLPFKGDTDLYIYPGYRWKVVDILVTNFHMPDSSLILLVSSFAGIENIKRAYTQAIERDYKFLSYGDSMLIGYNLN